MGTTTVAAQLPPGPRVPRPLLTYLWLTRPTRVFDHCARRYGDPFSLRLLFAGDMVYVAGGTVHTLGPGSVVVETQQQSDTTYRLYDYGRPRELHLKDGLAAVKEKVNSGKVVRPAPERRPRRSGSPAARRRFCESAWHD